MAAQPSTIDLAIDQIDKTISDAPVLHAQPPLSGRSRAYFHFHMGTLWCRRYELSDDERDLDMTILHFTHTIFLPLPLSTIGGRILQANSILAFYYLATALHCRTEKFRRPTGSDINNCVKYFRYLQDRSLEPFIASYPKVLARLALALSLQVQLEPGHAMHWQYVEEMSVLSRELLAYPDVPGLALNDVIKMWAINVIDAVALMNQPSEQVFECLREAHTRLPDLRAASFALSFSLSRRFEMTRSSDDYEEAMAALDKIITSGPGDYFCGALETASTLAHLRSDFFGKPEYLAEAISRSSAYLGTLPLEDPQHHITTHIHTMLERERFKEFGPGVTNDPREAHSRDPNDVNILPLTISFLKSKLTPTQSASTSKALSNRIRMLDDQDTADRITEMADVEEAVKCYRLFLASLQPSPSPDDVSTAFTIEQWGDLLLRAFQHTNKLDYLNESISVFRGILKAPHFPFSAIRTLIESLTVRFSLSYDRKDFDEAMQLYPIAATYTYASAPLRFFFACRWALTARISQHPSTSTAYENASSLMQDSLAFAPTLEIQHFRLLKMHDDFKRLPLNHASYRVHAGQLEQAIVTLEQGRGHASQTRN